MGDNANSDFIWRMTLDLEFWDDDPEQKLSVAKLRSEPLLNSDGTKLTTLIPDRFEYCGQTFFLKKPIRGLPRLPKGRHTWFNQQRYIAVLGNKALHVFDLHKMQFVLADETRGLDVTRNVCSSGLA